MIRVRVDEIKKPEFEYVVLRWTTNDNAMAKGKYIRKSDGVWYQQDTRTKLDKEKQVKFEVAYQLLKEQQQENEKEEK